MKILAGTTEPIEGNLTTNNVSFYLYRDFICQVIAIMEI